MRQTSDGLSPIRSLATTPPQRLHSRIPNPCCFHCGRWNPERGRGLTVPVRELEATFLSPYARWTEPFHLIVILSSNSTDLPQKLHERSLRDPPVDQRWSELSFTSSALTVESNSYPTATRQRKGRSSNSRPQLDVKFDGRGQTANFLDLANNSTAEDEGNLDDHNYPYSKLSYQAAAILRITAVIAAVLMVQEERKADEFGPEPKPEEVEDACEVSLMKKPSVWRRNTEEGYRGSVENRQLDDGRGAWDDRCRRKG